VKLFRYEPVEVNRLETLNQNKLFFSSVDNFDDPSDSVPVVVPIDENINVAASRLEAHLRLEKVIYDKLYKKKYITGAAMLSVLVGEEDEKKLLTAYGYELAGCILRDNIGVCCFSGGENPNPVLFSQYAASHNGVCVEYESDDDNEHLFEVDYLDLVKYHPFSSTILSLIGENGSIDISDDEVYQPFLHKHSSWSYQKEYRIFTEGVNILRQASDYGLKISGIYFGQRCDDMTISLVTDTLSSHNISFYQYVREFRNRAEMWRVDEL